ncbi:hypothetical protein [Corynebacterium variabile]|uniref:hypothetical protein n=1 Tax=Corynebacterium variabile TaxID=1727 RepID=UPI003F90E744
MNGQRRDPAALRHTAVWGVLQFLSGLLAAFALAGFMAQFRTMAFRDIGGTEDWLPADIPLWAFIGSIVLAVAWVFFSASFYCHWNNTWSGRTDHTVGVGAFTLWWAGFATGLWIFTNTLWETPATVGSTDGHDWNTGTWIQYEMNLWVPALATAATVVCHLLWRRHPFADRSARFVDYLLASSPRLTGTVTKVSRIPSGDAARTAVTWTFTYEDAAGTRHEVTRREYFSAAVHPEPGAPVWVLTDPDDPDNHEALWVSLTDSTSTPDYIRQDAR